MRSGTGRRALPADEEARELVLPRPAKGGSDKGCERAWYARASERSGGI